MCTCEPRLVLVSLLIGWKNGAKTLNQSLNEVIINQSNSLITFDTQLKTDLCILFWLGFQLQLPRPHVFGYFWIRNFFFLDSPFVHRYPANPACESPISRMENLEYVKNLESYGRSKIRIFWNPMTLSRRYTSDFLLALVMRIFQTLSRRQREIKSRV